MAKKQNNIEVVCYLADGTKLNVDEKTGKFDPPVSPPVELQIEVMKIINLSQGLVVEAVHH